MEDTVLVQRLILYSERHSPASAHALDSTGETDELRGDSDAAGSRSIRDPISKILHASQQFFTCMQVLMDCFHLMRVILPSSTLPEMLCASCQ